MEIKTTRKCHFCKENITLETDKFIVYKDDEYYHYDCFITFMNNKKRNKLSSEEIIDLAKKLQLQSNDKTKDIINKNHLYKYLQKRYDIVFLPSFVFIKFNDIFNGTYKNLSEPVEVEDLLDMWQRKESYLDKNYQWKLSKGESMDGMGRMWYDLAIILSLVGSYKKWKDTEEEKQKKIKALSFENKIDYNIISKNVKQRNEVKENYIIEEDEENL